MAKHVFTPLGASNHTAGTRPDHDYYATDPKALEMLLDLESFNPFIWEPAAGEGHLSNVLKARGYDVRESDLISRRPNIEQLDFFEYEGTWHGDIITNPPYNMAQAFIEHALHVVQPGAKVAMFLRLLFLEGKRRRCFFEAHPPKRVWVSSSRISCAKNGDFNSATNAVAFAWFIWERGYEGDTSVKWFN